MDYCSVQLIGCEIAACLKMACDQFLNNLKRPHCRGVDNFFEVGGLS